jgi:hypothetical protein
MRKSDFRSYRLRVKSSKIGSSLTARVVGNIFSRCLKAERQIGRDLDTLVPLGSPSAWKDREDPAITRSFLTKLGQIIAPQYENIWNFEVRNRAAVPPIEAAMIVLRLDQYLDTGLLISPYHAS